MKQLLALYRKCKDSHSNFLSVITRYLYYKILYKQRFLLHEQVTILGAKNIKTQGRLEIGVKPVGFSHKADKTYLNIRGKLELGGTYSIGRGCRFDVGPNGIVSIGSGGYTNCNTSFIIMHRLTIGNDCVISWDCQFLDDDFHEINYADKKESNNAITIGNNVWIGCGVKIYKGTTIPNGCVIASDSIVRGEYSEENSIIGGNPAKLIKSNIEWK